MPRYNVVITINVEAENIPEARGIGEEAFRHLYETFNDDGSISIDGFVEVLV